MSKYKKNYNNRSQLLKISSSLDLITDLPNVKKCFARIWFPLGSIIGIFACCLIVDEGVIANRVTS